MALECNGGAASMKHMVITLLSLFLFFDVVLCFIPAEIGGLTKKVLSPKNELVIESSIQNELRSMKWRRPGESAGSSREPRSRPSSCSGVILRVSKLSKEQGPMGNGPRENKKNNHLLQFQIADLLEVMDESYAAEESAAASSSLFSNKAENQRMSGQNEDQKGVTRKKNKNQSDLSKKTSSLNKNSPLQSKRTNIDNINASQKQQNKSNVEKNKKLKQDIFTKVQIASGKKTFDLSPLNNKTTATKPPTPDHKEEELNIETTSLVCTNSDGKIPGKVDALPAKLFQSGDNNVIDQLGAINNAIAYQSTKDLKYLESSKPVYVDETEEEELLSVLRSSLEDAGFQPLTKRDLDLCSALNAGYLFRLSLLEDLSQDDPNIVKQFYPEKFAKKRTTTTSCNNETAAENNNIIDEDESFEDDFLFDGRVLVFWRGYSQEEIKGRLLLPKFDFLQASLVQKLAMWVTNRLECAEIIASIRLLKTYRKIRLTVRSSIRSVLGTLPNKKVANYAQRVLLEKNKNRGRSSNPSFYVKKKRLKSQRLFKLSRYGGSQVRFDGSLNPLNTLKPFLLKDNADNESNIKGYSKDSKLGDSRSLLEDSMISCEYDERNNDLVRTRRSGQEAVTTAASPPMQLLERVCISNVVDIFSRTGRKDFIKRLFDVSNLVEPTYEKVIVVWRPLPDKPTKSLKPVIVPPKFVYDFCDMLDIQGILPDLPGPIPEPKPKPLQIRAFNGVPMANLPAVLPKTRLIFRPADALLFDLISIVTFLLVIGSQKFDNPRLDLIALVSVVLWTVRTFFRYSNKLARYDLLVKKFLTTKIAQRDSGALKYITAEAGSQRAKRAALVHLWLSESDITPPYARSDIIHNGEREVNKLLLSNNLKNDSNNDVNNKQQQNIRIDIDAALYDLEDLGLVRFSSDGQNIIEIVTDELTVQDALKEVWANVFLQGGESSSSASYLSRNRNRDSSTKYPIKWED